MCLLNACCFCIFLDVGCIIIATLLLISRLLLVILMLNEPQYKDLDVFKEVTAAHVSVILLLIGCVIPIFLCCGVMTENPQCVYLFISMEIFHLILFSAWEIYFIVHYMDEKNREELKKIKDEDYFWVPPLISILLEIYFLWVAYSYYRALLDYYYDYYPAVFYY